MNASCEHFSEYFKDFGPTAFNIIHGIFSACVSQEARRQKVSDCIVSDFVFFFIISRGGSVSAGQCE